MNNDWKPTEINEGQPTNWKPTPQTPEQVDEGLRNAFRQAIKDGVMDATPYLEKCNTYGGVSINVPKPSNWKCYLFGGDEGFSPITWVPVEGKVPNVWVRFWMKVFFDCKWVKSHD